MTKSSTILQYFWPALSDYQSWNLILVFFLSGRLRQVLLYSKNSTIATIFALTKFKFYRVCYCLQVYWTKITPDKTSFQIWVQIIWHVDGTLIFSHNIDLRRNPQIMKHEKLPSMQITSTADPKKKHST